MFLNDFEIITEMFLNTFQIITEYFSGRKSNFNQKIKLNG